MNNSVTLTDFFKELTIPDIAAITMSLIAGLICLVGIIFALIRWKRHRAVSMLAVVALSLQAICVVTIPTLRLYIVEYMADRISGTENYQEKLAELFGYYRSLPSAFDVIEISIEIIIVILFLVAIFYGRAKEPLNPSQ